MKIKSKEWIILTLIGIFCFTLWYKLEYPRFSSVDLSIDKQKALSLAYAYLKSKGVNTEEYLRAIVFDTDEWCNRYLQKTLGWEGEEQFIKQYDYDLFFWKIRFFKELQKEEYIVRISARTGNVLSYQHLIEDIAPREKLAKNAAKEKAEKFLKDNYGLNLTEYDFYEEKIKQHEKRIDYVFSWKKKGVYVPWKKNEGGAKLLSGVTVSGNEIRDYYKDRLDVPEAFQRYVENQFLLSGYLYNFYFILWIILIMFSVNIVVRRRYDVIPRFVKRWFCYLAAIIAVINLANIFNNLEDGIMAYPTSIKMASFIGLYITRTILNIMFLLVGFIMPALAGESLYNEVFPKNKYSSFLHYIRSNFFNRNVSKAIIFSYMLAVIILGLQAAMFYLGQRYLGVWREWLKLTQFSSAYIPLLSVFVLSVTASFNEEIAFRLFGISWIKKYFRNILAAIILTSFAWGLGHTAYAIFPVWFRVLEITLLGFLFGFVFLRYGIIVLIVAHYLFDVFWGSASYILGHSPMLLFLSSIMLLSLPLVFALVAYFLNKGEREKEIKNILDKIQQYNLNILVAFISAKKLEGVNADYLKSELIKHNWDPLLVSIALEKVFRQ
jgi:hypothetical protein